MNEWEPTGRAEVDETKPDPLLKAVGKQIKLLRKRAGLSQTAFGARIGYSLELVSSVERGRRAPQGPFIDGVERELDAGGVVDAIKEDIEEARLPVRFRDFAKWEKEAVSVYAYAPLTIPGLLQTESYARALIGGHCPPLSEEVMADRVTARMERQRILQATPAVVLGFVIEESVLHRPVGGQDIMREQLERLWEVSQLPHVSLQIMPTACWQHSGVLGGMTVLETKDGRTIAYTESQSRSEVVTDVKAAQVYAQRLGIIRAQALNIEESARLIKELLGEV